MAETWLSVFVKHLTDDRDALAALCHKVLCQFYSIDDFFVLFFVGTVGTFSISNNRRLPSSAGPTHPLPDGNYLLDSLGVSQSRAPDYSMSGFNSSTKGRAQW